MKLYIIEEFWYNGLDWEDAAYETTTIGLYESIEKAKEALFDFFARHSEIDGYLGRFVENSARPGEVVSYSWVYDDEGSAYGCDQYDYRIREFSLNEMKGGILEREG